MRSLLLTLVLGLGALGLSLGAPTQARAADFRSPAIYSGATTPVAYWWRGPVGWRRGFYPYGYGFYGNYGYRSYYPGFYGGYYGPWGGYYAPYGSFYYRRGFWW